MTDDALDDMLPDAPADDAANERVGLDEAARITRLTPEQKEWLRYRLRGHTQGESARLAGYSARDEKDFRSRGTKIEHSPRVQAAMALLAAEGNDHPLKRVGDMQELQAILWQHCRGPNANSAVRSALILTRLMEEEAQQRPPASDQSPEEILAQLAKISPVLAVATADRHNYPLPTSRPTVEAALRELDRLRRVVLAWADVSTSASNGHAADNGAAREMAA